jgi:hypothetical protein
MDIDKIINLQYYSPTSGIYIAIYDHLNLVLVNRLSNRNDIGIYTSKTYIEIIPITKKSIASVLINWFSSGIDDEQTHGKYYDIEIYDNINNKFMAERKLTPEQLISSKFTKEELSNLQIELRNKKLDTII